MRFVILDATAYAFLKANRPDGIVLEWDPADVALRARPRRHLHKFSRRRLERLLAAVGEQLKRDVIRL